METKLRTVPLNQAFWLQDDSAHYEVVATDVLLTEARPDGMASLIRLAEPVLVLRAVKG